MNNIDSAIQEALELQADGWIRSLVNKIVRLVPEASDSDSQPSTNDNGDLDAIIRDEFRDREQHWARDWARQAVINAVDVAQISLSCIADNMKAETYLAEFSLDEISKGDQAARNLNSGTERLTKPDGNRQVTAAPLSTTDAQSQAPLNRFPPVLKPRKKNCPAQLLGGLEVPGKSGRSGPLSTRKVEVFLEGAGYTPEPKQTGERVYRQGQYRISIPPIHGGQKELKIGTQTKILKRLGEQLSEQHGRPVKLVVDRGEVVVLEPTVPARP